MLIALTSPFHGTKNGAPVHGAPTIYDWVIEKVKEQIKRRFDDTERLFFYSVFIIMVMPDRRKANVVYFFPDCFR
jgi:hypothetical protein